MKYRFVVVICWSVQDRSTIYEQLSVLVDQGYVMKLYDKTYRLRKEQRFTIWRQLALDT